ncbi:hypothetical protein AGLY_012412 [Aphis glycines]|uniref:DUF4371 domain-containing protein n=1 Tax=Aphis glycines TaxID=307491 RepID=A0A6G0T9Z4_APHGL|nr:hypothetical protein AGLY_012412 [Aphis glycines]
MSISKKAVKRKYEEEKREFKLEWKELYFFKQKNDKPFCPICQLPLSQFKVGNLKRHYETNHSTFSREFPIGSALIQNKLCSMKLKFSKQTNVMKMFTNEAGNWVEASFVTAFNIAQAKCPYTDGEYIKKKKNTLDVISVLNPENQKLLKMVENVPVSRHTIKRRISTISFDIFTNFKNNIDNCLSLSLVLDESTDIQKNLSWPYLFEITRGIDIKIALDETLKKPEIPLNKIIRVSTDGAPSMVGCKNGLIELLKKDIEDDIPNDVPWYCLVRWLSVNNFLAKFFQLLEPIKRLEFFTDIMQHLSILNVSLRGQNKLVIDLVQKVFSFQNKLKFFIKDLKFNNYTHFSCLEEIEACLIESEIKINCDDYVFKLEFLFSDFEEQLPDLKALKPPFGFLENLFLVNVIANRCHYHILSSQIKQISK